MISLTYGVNSMSTSKLSSKDLDDLRSAKQLLENPGFAAKVANLIGVPIEAGFKLLPQGAKDMIATATKKSLESALHVAVSTMKNGTYTSSNWSHKAAVIASGALGGAFGLPALAVELPISTAIMLRSIADIARSEGESIASVDGRLACLEVFALGGRNDGDDGMETAYYATRAALARAIAEAAQFVAERSVVQESAPPLLALIAQISTRFGIQVSEKAMAQLLPVIGAAGGAVVNTLFIDHFQDMARGHFIVRRLERTYGEEVVETAYNSN